MEKNWKVQEGILGQTGRISWNDKVALGTEDLAHVYAKWLYKMAAKSANLYFRVVKDN